VRWIIALVAVAVAAGLRFALDPWLASAQSYLMVVDAVLFALIVGMGVAMHAARRRAEASEEKFRRFMENAPAAVFIKDEAGRYVYMNAAAQGVVGVPDWQGKTDDELLPPEAARYLLLHGRRDLRWLLTVLDALDRYSLQTRRPITLLLTREVLQAVRAADGTPGEAEK